MTGKPAALEPGIYLGLPFEQYLNDPAVSYSDCRRLLAGEYWAGSVHNPARVKPPVSDPMAMGSQCHCLLLEPEAFHERYLVTPGDAWRKHETRQIVQRSAYQEMLAMREVLRGMEEADMLLNRQYGYPEVTLVWDDEETGVRCRSRHDFCCWEWTVDYKTAQSVEGGFIQYSFRRYKYEMQTAHYSEGRRGVRKMLKAGTAHFYGDFSGDFVREFEGAEDDFFIFLFQKKASPHPAVAFTLDEKSRQDGLDQRRDALAKYRKGVEKHGLSTPWDEGHKGMKEFSTWYGFNGGE